MVLMYFTVPSFFQTHMGCERSRSTGIRASLTYKREASVSAATAREKSDSQRKLIMVTSHEKRKVETSRLPRTATKITTDSIKNDLGVMGLDITDGQDVSQTVDYL
jgi:hypothetical protein